MIINPSFDIIRYMIDHQEHYGKKFYQDKKTGYWISTDHPRIRAHRWVWNCCHGVIPKGYHIHHKNENKSDNLIENLELIEASRHLSLHYSEEMRERSRKQAETVRHMTKEWHASAEGKAWHSLHAIKSKFGKWEPKEYKCDQCGASYQSTKRSGARFCTNACKSKWRRETGFDNIEASCVYCSKTFIKSKYAKTKFCSRSCCQRARLIK